MKTTFLLFFVFIILLALPVKAFHQDKKDYLKAIGISIPDIWNNSYGINYSTGNRREPTGIATIYGINVNYSRFVFKNIFIQGF